MAPTAESLIYKSESASPYHLPPIRRGYPLSDPALAGGRAGETNDAHLSLYAPGLFSQRNLAPRSISKDVFPPSASVSIPTSTTALEYLLHKHTLRSDTIDAVARPLRDRYKSEGAVDVGKWTSPNMTKTMSASDAGSYEPRRSKDSNAIAQQFFQKEPCIYTHRMFKMAGKIFAVLRTKDEKTEELNAMRKRKGFHVVENDTIPDMEFKDLQEQVKTFELTFAALKFQTLLHDILDRTGFFFENSNLRDDQSLVCIILYDLQSRKFQRRTALPGEELDGLCGEIEEALLNLKTRILSVIAKERIKNNAPSIEYLLPEHVRNKDETKCKTPVYLWVNQFKTSVEEIVEALKMDGYSVLEPGLDITEETGDVFKIDEHCSDLLVFQPHLQLKLKESDYVKAGALVLQDKSSCLAPQSVHYLLGLEQDVIHVNIGTGMSTAHLASLLRKKSPHSHIWGFANDSPEKARKALKNLEFLGVKNTKVLMDNFMDVDPEDTRFKNVKVILISTNCSKSAITSPVQFIVSEGEDMKVLGELSKADSSATHIGNLKLEHEQLLKQALKFPKVQAVVYTTRSRYEAENESVVTRVLEYINMTSANKKAPFRVTPPVLPFSGDEIDTGESGVDGRFVRFLPSSKANGCFVAVISREPQDPKEVARNTIAKARSKGMLGKGQGAEVNGEGDDTSKSEASRKHHGKTSASEVTSLKVKVSSHKSAAAIGARLYQAGLLSKMQQVKLKAHKPEHVKVVKHPAPFR